MSPARPGPRPSIPTEELLLAVAVWGRRWPVALSGHDVVSVNEAVDRELLCGNLVDGHTLSPRGRRALEGRTGRRTDLGTIELREDYACKDHDPCWTACCERCAVTLALHVTADGLEERVAAVITGHACPGSPAPRPVAPRRARDLSASANSAGEP